MRNPDWVRDEIILAMNLYVREGRRQLPATHSDVIRLSQILNTLPIHPQSQRDENFRNPNGVSMILGNFLGIDPMHAQPGLSRNNRLQETVWRDFVDQGELLGQTAEAIEHCALHGLHASGANPTFDEEAFPEGTLLTRLHRIRERNPELVERKKSQVLALCGRLECEACRFDFYETYGDLGRGFAECHHTVPLAEAAFVQATRLSDLAIVCANCHRMLHRACPAMTVALLRSHLCSRRQQGTSSVDSNYASANLSR